MDAARDAVERDSVRIPDYAVRSYLSSPRKEFVGRFSGMLVSRMRDHVLNALRQTAASAFAEQNAMKNPRMCLEERIRRKWDGALSRMDSYSFIDSAGRTWDNGLFPDIGSVRPRFRRARVGQRNAAGSI